ncbi:response regulator [Larkinella sp.]|uniref:response regulator n=1 Tax=Larkinella sp. TaxID=2034517 RepID=UPI003BA96764
MAFDLSRKKILLAEDDGDDREFFIDFLGSRTDIELLPGVTSGVEVLDYLHRITSPDELPDIVILDQNMPKLTGKETLTAIKATDWLAQIAVVIYSTYVGRELIDECLKLGAILVKSKPVSKDGYNEMMNEILAACRRVSVS